MSRINKKLYINELYKVIKKSEKLEKHLISKTKAHQFLNTARGENKILLVNLLAYLLNKNLFYQNCAYSEKFFRQQLILTHRASLQSIHIAMEQCFKQIIRDKKLGKVVPNKNIEYDEIIKNLNESPKIQKQLEKLKQKHAGFFDYLDKILEKVNDNQFKSVSKNFFIGLNIIRNKLSHSPLLNGKYKLSRNEENNLKSSELRKAVTSNNLLQFDIQFYYPIFSDLDKFLEFYYD